MPFDPIRAQINRKVTQSKREIPHFYLSVTVDMTAAAAYRESHGKKVSFNALLMKAVVAGLAGRALAERGVLPTRATCPTSPSTLAWPLKRPRA